MIVYDGNGTLASILLQIAPIIDQKVIRSAQQRYYQVRNHRTFRDQSFRDRSRNLLRQIVPSTRRRRMSSSRNLVYASEGSAETRYREF